MTFSDNTSDDSGSAAEEARHVSGAHLLALSGKPAATRISALLGGDLANLVVGWNVKNIFHGRSFDECDPANPARLHATDDPRASDVLVIPVEQLRDWMHSNQIETPTRQDCIDFAASDDADGGDGIDPEVELTWALYATDTDLGAASQTGRAPRPSERRVCGVPESIYTALEDYEQAWVEAGEVIAGPEAPTAVARWLVRTHFAQRLPVPGRRGSSWMRTVVRIDQTWYEYAATKPGEPPRWVARADREWMPNTLRRILSTTRYVHARHLKDEDIYTVKSWNPKTQSIAEVEQALCALLDVGTGTAARELPNLYGRSHRVYPAGSASWALCRNGVLDVSSGQLVAATPLWFSLTRIEAEYDHTATATGSRWLDMLAAQWPDDPGAITCLQQWFGYVLSGRTDLQRIMMIFGPGGTGKSIIAAVLEALVGSSVELGIDALSTPFGLEDAYTSGATLAVMSDSRNGSRDTSLAASRLLSISGCDKVNVNRKGRQAVSTALPVRFHITANEIPRILDHSNALLSRLLILETTSVFRGTDREDPGLLAHITRCELGRVLRWAVEGLALLDAADGVFTREARADEHADEVSSVFSNVAQFLGDCCELGGANDCLDLRKLFEVFGAWAHDVKSGEKMSQRSFTSALKSHGDPIRPGQKRVPKGERAGRVVYGIKRAEITVDERNSVGGRVPRTYLAVSETADPFSDSGA